MVTCYKYEMVEEKKTEDAHEAPLDDESESSSASSIIKKGELFVDGLDSSLSSLISTDENASSILKKGELLADGLDSSMSSLISTDENLDLNPPLMERRSVSFTGIGTSPASAANIPTGASGVESEIKKLREKMTEAQIDYQAEKATRKRKEKNLVKLAKELNKRTTEIDFKDRQIKRLTDTVTQMEEQKLATGTDISGHDGEIAAAQQKYRVTCREYDARLEAIQKEHEETCRELYGQIKEANKQVFNLKNELVPTETPRVHSKKSFAPSPVNGMPRFLVVAGFVGAVLVAVLNQIDLLSIDAVCAPVMPGTTLDTQDAVFEAPWWAPSLQKETAFEALCEGRMRSRLVVSGGKLTAYRLLKNGSFAVLWNKKVASTRVGSRTLTLRDNKGHAENVESPWLL